MLQKRLTEMTPDERQVANNIVQRTYDILMGMYASVAEQSVKALFLINGGGVVTLLAYLHDPSSSKNNFLLISLGCFLLGLLLTVIVVSINYYVCREFLKNYEGNLKIFNEGKINLSELQKYTNCCLQRLGIITIFIGYIAALLFIIGCCFGVYGFFLR